MTIQFKHDKEYFRKKIMHDYVRYNNELTILAKKKISAFKANMNECNKCGFCCHKCPCDFTKLNLINTSKYLGLTVKEVFQRYMNIKFYSENKLTVQPVRKNQQEYAGRVLPVSKQFSTSPCIFLHENNLCSLRAVHPEGAKTASCWKPDETMHTWDSGEDIKFLETLIENYD